MTKKLLLTAFMSYGDYPWNVSEQALYAMLEGAWYDGIGADARFVFSCPPRELRSAMYPVEFDRIEANLRKDLTPEIGAAILMGQAPGRATIDLERFAVNAGVLPGSDGAWFPLEAGGPEATTSDLPLDEWTARLKNRGLPARQSFHAGTYLCNASLYHALRNFRQRDLPGAAVFLHLPLAKELFPDAEVALPMETILKTVEATVDLATEWIADQERRDAGSLA